MINPIGEFFITSTSASDDIVVLLPNVWTGFHCYLQNQRWCAIISGGDDRRADKLSCLTAERIKLWPSACNWKNWCISRCAYLHYRWFLLFLGLNLRVNISCDLTFTNWFRILTNFVSIASHILPLHAEAKLSELIRAGMIRHTFISGWMSIER